MASQTQPVTCLWEAVRSPLTCYQKFSFSQKLCCRLFKIDFSDVYQTQWKHQAKYGGVMISPDFRDLITRRAYFSRNFLEAFEFRF